MDYSEMNLAWGTYLPRFKDLLRPEGYSALHEEDAPVEEARADASVSVMLSSIYSTLPYLVFESYADWYSYQDEWVLRNLGHVLTTEEEHYILSRLDQGTSSSLLEVLHYIADERLGVWQAAARAEFAESEEQAAASPLTGSANRANWEASRTPGTYYYTYSDDRYLYSDLPEGPIEEWETLPVREQLASENASLWGNDGWYYTPTGEPELYGGAYVYAADREGPWMTEEQARVLIEEQAAAARRYHPVALVSGYHDWAHGFDKDEQTWKYALVTGDELPGDDADWIAVDTFSEDGTEYFAGPGYGEGGWVPYTDPQQADPAAAEQREEALQTVRASVVAPAAKLVESRLRGKLPPELVERFGSRLEEMAEQLVAARAARYLAEIRPVGTEG